MRHTDLKVGDLMVETTWAAHEEPWLGRVVRVMDRSFRVQAAGSLSGGERLYRSDHSNRIYQYDEKIVPLLQERARTIRALMTEMKDLFGQLEELEIG